MIYVGGAQRTSTGYLWGIVAKILKYNSQYKSISQVLSDNKKIYPFDIDGTAMDVVQPLRNLGFNVLTIKYYDNIKNKKFLYYENNFLEPKYIASKCSVFQTHKSMRLYKNNEMDDYISHYLFIHRNPFDEAVSIIKAQSISKEKYFNTINSEVLDFELRRYPNNNMNYGIYPNDLQHAFNYLRIVYFNEIRFNALDFIRYKNDGNVYEFTFENLTIKNKLNEIKRIAKILSFNNNCVDIFDELEDELHKGVYWYKKGKKTNTAKEFFDSDVILRINKLFGDISVLLGYQTLDQFSSFISSNNNFTVICIGIDNFDVENIQNIFNSFNKDIDLKVISKFEILDIEVDKKYIYCTENINEYKKIKNKLDINSIVYPYYESLLGVEEVVFSLNNKESKYLDKNLLENSILIWDKESCSDSILLQKCKEHTKLMSIDTIPMANTNVILLSFNQELIRNFTLKHIDKCNIFSFLPMYNFDKLTLCELFGDKK